LIDQTWEKKRSFTGIVCAYGRSPALAAAFNLFWSSGTQDECEEIQHGWILTLQQKRLLLVDEAARILNVSRWTVYRWVEGGRLGCLIGFVCAMTTPVFAGEQRIILMLGGKFCEAYLGDAGRLGYMLPPRYCSAVTEVDALPKICR
jgi:hypothetical protein